MAPIVGFIVASIPLRIAGQNVHKRVEHYYKYNVSELRLGVVDRLNARLGICIGLMNGAAYFVLDQFFLFNLAYWSTQMAAKPPIQPLLVRLANQLGRDCSPLASPKRRARWARCRRIFTGWRICQDCSCKIRIFGTRLADILVWCHCGSATICNRW